ncbi:MAG: DUF1802 family protein [Planctomycetaceae bacterium]
MLPANNVAFKEWAAICQALAEGRQAIILRKGGVHEGRAGFQVAHGEFWLFPTYLHEAENGLVADGRQLLDRARAEQPRDGMIRLAQYVVVTDVLELTDERQLGGLAGEHLWSAQTVADRFHYRHPGLFALVVRVYNRDHPHVIPDSPHFGGCRSWVELPLSLPADGMRAALSDEQFFKRRDSVLAVPSLPFVT